MPNPKEENKESRELIESLSPNERKILPYLSESFERIVEKSGLDEAGALRALEYLSNKKIISLKITSEKIISLGKNGIVYKNLGLPERRLINLLAEKKKIKLGEAKKESKLDDNEFQAALGALKKKALLNLINGELIFNGTREEISIESIEEKFISELPKPLEKLEP